MPPTDALKAAARAWHEKAAGDLATARLCATAGDIPAWIVGFHLQQAAEKCLKGFLVLAGREPPHVHSLVRLDRLLEEVGGTRPLALEHVGFLEPFAVEDRYPTLMAPESDRNALAPLLAPVSEAVEALHRVVGTDTNGN